MNLAWFAAGFFHRGNEGFTFHANIGRIILRTEHYWHGYIIYYLKHREATFARIWYRTPVCPKNSHRFILSYNIE
jgi:hypothetical protein